MLKCVAWTFGLKEISTPSGHCDNNLRIISVDTQTTQSFGQRFLWFVPRNDEGILSLRNFTLGHISTPLVELWFVYNLAWGNLNDSCCENANYLLANNSFPVGVLALLPCCFISRNDSGSYILFTCRLMQPAPRQHLWGFAYPPQLSPDWSPFVYTSLTPHTWSISPCG